MVRLSTRWLLITTSLWPPPIHLVRPQRGIAKSPANCCRAAISYPQFLIRDILSATPSFFHPTRLFLHPHPLPSHPPPECERGPGCAYRKRHFTAAVDAHHEQVGPPSCLHNLAHGSLAPALAQRVWMWLTAQPSSVAAFVTHAPIPACWAWAGDHFQNTRWWVFCSALVFGLGNSCSSGSTSSFPQSCLHYRTSLTMSSPCTCKSCGAQPDPRNLRGRMWLKSAVDLGSQMHQGICLPITAAVRKHSACRSCLFWSCPNPRRHALIF